MLYEQLEQYIENAPLIAIGIAYLGGVITSFTPCVFPVIPITVGVLGLQQSQSKVQALIRAVMYVLSMALVYAALGMLAAMTGRFFGQVSVHPITNLIVGNVCLLFALAMLDVIHIPIPSFLTNRRVVSGKEKGILGVCLMGAVSGTIVAPCTAPVLGTILTFVASAQSMVYGSALMFAFAWGLGTLLIIVGVFSGVLSTLSKGGTVMTVFKAILGVFMILVAEFFIFRAGRLWY